MGGRSDTSNGVSGDSVMRWERLSGTAGDQSRRAAGCEAEFSSRIIEEDFEGEDEEDW
jgi:hypothetical protein